MAVARGVDRGHLPELTYARRDEFRYELDRRAGRLKAAHPRAAWPASAPTVHLSVGGGGRRARRKREAVVPKPRRGVATGGRGRDGVGAGAQQAIAPRGKGPTC